MKNVVDDGRIRPQRKEHQPSQITKQQYEQSVRLMNCFVKINHSNCAVESAVVSCTNETGSTFSCLYLLQGQKSHLYPLKLYCHKSWTPVVNKYQYMFCVLDASEYKVQNHQVQDCGGYSTGLYCLRTPQHLSGKQPICLTDAIHLV